MIFIFILFVMVNFSKGTFFTNCSYICDNTCYFAVSFLGTLMNRWYFWNPFFVHIFTLTMWSILIIRQLVMNWVFLVITFFKLSLLFILVLIISISLWIHVLILFMIGIFTFLIGVFGELFINFIVLFIFKIIMMTAAWFFI